MKKTYACRCSVQLLETMRELSERNKVSRATFFTTALRHYINRMIAAGIISPEAELPAEESPTPSPRSYGYDDEAPDTDLYAAENQEEGYGK